MLIDKVKGTRQYVGPNIYMKWHIFAEWNMEILHLLSSIRTDGGKLRLPRSKNATELADDGRTKPHFYLRKDSCEELFGFYEAVDILKNKAKPTYTGFAIGSPGAPHLICASDQIRASWIKADITIIESGAAKSSV